MIKDIITDKAPVWLQNSAITLYNSYQWRTRRSGKYQMWREFFAQCTSFSKAEIEQRQRKLLEDFLAFATAKSEWYSNQTASAGLESFPLLEKADIVGNLDAISTISPSAGIVSHTGGTTGASLEVRYTVEDMQQRFALLDWFRSLYGWELGKRTAWFSGKSLTRDTDIAKGIVYRDDWFNKIRFFSTFHINDRNFDHYWKALCQFQPEFLVGFPSSILEICQIAKRRGLTSPSKVTAFFPTAETVLDIHRETIGEVLGCSTHDQYASSEGAPFILECPHGRMHIHTLSGVFEIVDQALTPQPSGELLVTSFTTHGTPLIRYRVGDCITLEENGCSCECGWPFPMVKEIDGRTSDFLWSPTHGRVNLGNLSNSTKGVAGIVCFQVQQDQPSEIRVLLVADDRFDGVQEANLLQALKVRTGEQMNIVISKVPEIPRERSGKFRIIKNTLRADQMTGV